MTKLSLKKTYASPEIAHGTGRGFQRLSGISFAEPAVGWVVGAGQLLLTRDGGVNWLNKCPATLCSSLSPSRVAAVTRNACWVLGTSNSGMYYTSDGGVSWYMRELHPRFYPKDIFFIDSEVGWVICASDVAGPVKSSRIYFTQDSGRTWVPDDLEQGGFPRRIKFIDRQTGWLLVNSYDAGQGYYCKVLLTENGGRSWEGIKRFNQIVLDFISVSERHLIVFGVDGFMSETTDRGRTWRRVRLPRPETINGISVFKKTFIAACDAGTILISADKADTWESFKTDEDSGNYIASVFTSESSGVLVSSHSITQFTLG